MLEQCHCHAQGHFITQDLECQNASIRVRRTHWNSVTAIFRVTLHRSVKRKYQGQTHTLEQCHCMPCTQSTLHTGVSNTSIRVRHIHWNSVTACHAQSLYTQECQNTGTVSLPCTGSLHTGMSIRVRHIHWNSVTAKHNAQQFQNATCGSTHTSARVGQN